MIPDAGFCFVLLFFCERNDMASKYGMAYETVFEGIRYLLEE